MVYRTDLSLLFVVVLLVSPHLRINLLPVVAHGDIGKGMRVIWVKNLHKGGIGMTKGRLTKIIETVAAKLRWWEGSAQAAGAQQLRADDIKASELVEHGYGEWAPFMTKVYRPVGWHERSPFEVGLGSVELVVD